MAATDARETTEISTFPSDKNNSISDMESDQIIQYYYSLADDINFYGLSIVIAFGLTGNLFSLLIFLTSSVLRQTTTGQYLIALACVDSLLLVGDLMRWMAAKRYGVPEQHYYLAESLGLNVLDTSKSACQMTHFLRHGSSFCSAWITTVIAAERLVAIARPLMISWLSNPCRVRAVIVSIATVSYSLSAFPFWTVDIVSSGYNMSFCRIGKYMKETYDTWFLVVHRVLVLAIPVVLTTVLTVAIIWFLFRARRQRLSQLVVRSTLQAVPQSGMSKESQLTVMLLAVCIATTALRVPYSVAYEVRNPVREDPEAFEPWYHGQTYMAYKVTDVLNTSNYAINFVLYCFTGSLFRNQIKKLWSTCRGKNNSASSRPPTETSL